MSVVRWGDPPLSATSGEKRQTKWRRIAAELRARPGTWACVETKPTAHDSSMVANHVRKGIYADMAEGEFEAVARKVNGEYCVYARYVGEENQ